MHDTGSAFSSWRRISWFTSLPTEMGSTRVVVKHKEQKSLSTLPLDPAGARELTVATGCNDDGARVFGFDLFLDGGSAAGSM